MRMILCAVILSCLVKLASAYNDTAWCATFADNKQIGYVNWSTQRQVCRLDSCWFVNDSWTKVLIRNPSTNVITNESATYASSFGCNSFAFDYTKNQIWVAKPIDAYYIYNFNLVLVESIPYTMDNTTIFVELKSTSVTPKVVRSVPINQNGSTKQYDLRGRVIRTDKMNLKSNIVITR